MHYKSSTKHIHKLIVLYLILATKLKRIFAKVPQNCWAFILMWVIRERFMVYTYVCMYVVTWVYQLHWNYSEYWNIVNYWNKFLKALTSDSIKRKHRSWNLKVTSKVLDLGTTTKLRMYFICFWPHSDLKLFILL